MKMETCTRKLFAFTASVLTIAGVAMAASAQSSDATLTPAEAQAREVWAMTMHKTSAPSEGCFTAEYPSTRWERVQCAPVPGYRSAIPTIRNREQVVGNGYDYVAQAPSGHYFTSVVGNFPTVSGVKTEKSVGVAAFGGGGILGSNEYTLQVNTNFDSNSAACAGYSGCFAWQQYVMSTNTPVSLTSSQLTNETEVFIEYWLINYGVDNGTNICPSGFIDAGADATGPGDDCVQNTPATLIAKGQIAITNLAKLKLSATAAPGGTDAATVTYGTSAYTATVKDSYTDIAGGWNQAEFNVLGNAGGSRADFNSKSSITAKMVVTDGSTAAPTCVSPSSYAGTTGETNNLNAKSCTTGSGSAPYIQFVESN